MYAVEGVPVFVLFMVAQTVSTAIVEEQAHNGPPFQPFSAISNYATLKMDSGPRNIGINIQAYIYI